MGWRETKGEEPECLDDYDYIWIYSRSGGIEITETWGCFDWSAFSHWQPANIKIPKSPELTS